MKNMAFDAVENPSSLYSLDLYSFYCCWLKWLQFPYCILWFCMHLSKLSNVVIAEWVARLQRK